MLKKKYRNPGFSVSVIVAMSLLVEIKRSMKCVWNYSRVFYLYLDEGVCFCVF